jgi:HEAT repeat protein
VATFRRVLNSKKYNELDRQRDLYSEKLIFTLNSESMPRELTDFRSRPKSIKWQAIEEILLDLINEDRYKNDVKKIFNSLGYVAYYEKRLQSRNVITRSLAVYRLGRMLSERSTDKLTDMLKLNNAEVISVTIKSLCKIGAIKGLRSILSQLPDLYENNLVSRKIIEASLVTFGINAVPVLIENGRKSKDRKTIASILEVLSNFQSREVLPFAEENITHEDAEIRAKALKVIGNIDAEISDFDGGKIVPMLNDPVWFVKLQVVKALGNLRYKKAADLLGALLLDDNWQIRNIAVMALINIDDTATNVLLKTLGTTDDIYAKERICEEIGKTDLVDRLIDNLNSNDKEIYQQSKKILKIMHSLNFSTQLINHSANGTKERIKNELNLIMHGEPVR